MTRLPLLLAACCFVNDFARSDDFTSSIAPYLKQHCIRCHNPRKARGELDLTSYRSDEDVARHFRRWTNISTFIRSGEMPPEEEPQPEITTSNAVVANIQDILAKAARKNAGDPGVILPRRLSNTEFDLSVRDLTGVDIRPTSDFPADPAGGEGFNNTGESLRMSPSLVRKYLGAAQKVASHMVLKPHGISFAPFPVNSYNERKAFTEQAIIRFYRQHDVQIEDYIEAAWRYRYRIEPSPGSIQSWAEARGLSHRYLQLVWDTLSRSESATGLLGEMGRLWNAIPQPESEMDTPAELRQLVDFIQVAQDCLGAPKERLIRPGAGNWPIQHLHFRTQTAAARDSFQKKNLKPEVLINAGRINEPHRNEARQQSIFLRVDEAFAGPGAVILFKEPLFSTSGSLPRNEEEREKHKCLPLRSVLEKHHPELAQQLKFGKTPDNRETDASWFAVTAPAVIEIPLTAELTSEVAGRNLLLQIAVDNSQERNGSAFVSHRKGEAPPERIQTGASLLMHAESPDARALESDATEFCSTFPNRFCYVDEKRGLAAGFHLVEGFFRDDGPLIEKVLTKDQVSELDRLWSELDFVTNRTETLIRGFVWFERSERHVLHDKRFDFLRPEDPLLVRFEGGDSSQSNTEVTNKVFPLLDRFEGLYLDRLNIKRQEDTLAPAEQDAKYDMVHEFFEDIRKGLVHQDRQQNQAEAKGLIDVKEFADRAWRRELSQQEAQSLKRLYQQLRNDGKSVEESLRGILTAVLLSPEFCFRYNSAPATEEVSPLNSHEVAARLSYFLWSSVPDEPLLQAASKKHLNRPEHIAEQTRRMMNDPRIESFAREFFGQWLRYRDFLSADPINAAAFRDYDDELRQAMAEEPVRLATWLIQQNRSVLELLTSDVTFVNERLARHYGGDLQMQYTEAVRRANNRSQWTAVSGLRAAGRGGLPGMAVILTTNSAGERPSPVKRGFWTVHHLLGQHFPPPPADVPELPTSEKGARQTIRELLKAHVADSKCAICHTHFDSIGLTMEGFDAIGRSRTKDTAGRQVSALAELPNGRDAEGINGLIKYLETERRNEFIETMCRKFLGYALGRSVLLSDQPLLDEMAANLQENKYRFSALFETVVLSPQFRNQRGRRFESQK